MSNPSKSLVGALCCSLILAYTMAWGQDIFTGNEGFGIVLKGTGATPAPLRSLSIQIPGNVELNNEVRFSKTGGDVCIALDDLTQNLFQERNCNGVYEAGPDEFFLGQIGGSNPRVFENATCANPYNPLIVTDSGTWVPGTDTYWEICVDDTINQPRFRAVCSGGVCPSSVIDIPPGQCLDFAVNGSPIETICADGTRTLAGVGRKRGSFEWPGLAMTGDGQNCNQDPTLENVNGSPVWGIRCPMTGNEVDGFITMAPRKLPFNFDPTGNLTFQIVGQVTVDEGVVTHHGVIQIDCVGDGESVGTFSTGNVGLDLGIEGLGEVHETASGAVDAVAAGCDPGDTLHVRWKSCDTDATPSAGCTSSNGAENNSIIFIISADYLKNAE